MALQLFHLGCIRYVVANRLLGDRSNLRFASVTMLDLFPRYRHFQRAMERSTPFPSKFLFIASNGLTMVAGTRPNRRKMVVSRERENHRRLHDNSIFSARERSQNSRIIDSRGKTKKKKEKRKGRKAGTYMTKLFSREIVIPRVMKP